MTTIRYRFGAFTLELPQLALTRDGLVVKLGTRALNLLAVLAEAQGALVARAVLIERVWPKQSIDESAIRVHLSAARKALGQHGGEPLIAAEAGRGYRITVPVSRELTAPEPRAGLARARLPSRVGAILGREPVVAALAEELRTRRFISLVGPGGIGKTTAALTIGQRVSDQREMDAWFVDLAPVTEGSTVAITLAAALGLPGSAADLTGRLAARLADRPGFILLDNCEHVVDAAAALAEGLLQAAPGLLLLATSREPLRAEGEWVHRLSALEVPSEAKRDSVEHAARFSATALFVERASAANADFRLDESNWPAVIEICHRLDGMPLAIELAAARSDTMPAQAIAAGLDDRFALLNRGRRTAVPRHRTLRGALDWSYDLLDPPVRALLDRLALFRGSFDADAAAALATGMPSFEGQAQDLLDELVAKSMVVAMPSASGTRFRLLDTTRHYGLIRLDSACLDEGARRSHALYLLERLAGSAAAWEGKAVRERLAEYSAQIDDVRSAIRWANAAGGGNGDPRLATELVIAGAPLWFHLSLPGEFLRHAERAIGLMESGDVDPARQVELLTAYGHALWHIEGPVTAMAGAFARALELAQTLGSEPLALRALWGVWAHRILAGDYAQSLALARKFDAQVELQGMLADRQTAAHMLALSHHFSGDHEEAMALLDVVIAGDAAPERANHANHAQVDGKIAVMSLLMRLLWMRGDLPRALAIAQECAQDAICIDHALSVCYGLAIGCIPVAIAAGEPALAHEWITALRARTERHGLDHWHRFVLGYSQALEGGGEPVEGASAMQVEMFAAASDPQAPVPWRREAAYRLFTTLHSRSDLGAGITLLTKPAASGAKVKDDTVPHSALPPISARAATALIEPASQHPVLDPLVRSFLDRWEEQVAGALDGEAEATGALRLAPDCVLVRPAFTSAPVPIFLYLAGTCEHAGLRLPTLQALADQAGVAVLEVAIAPEAGVAQLQASLDGMVASASAQPHLPVRTDRLAIGGDGLGASMAFKLALATASGGSTYQLLVMSTPVLGTPAEGSGNGWLPAARAAELSFTAAPINPSQIATASAMLPPALILTAEADPFRDAAEALARTLMAQEVDVTALRFLGTIHDFTWLPPLRDAPASTEACRLIAEALRKRLHMPPGVQ